eukprot:CAMPEP_0118932606 /NCGR_PEP_ID=MMETSP1169-20130426/10519_1 /TAXON_ID=36882 /ORGANISM="Pyramimonas obovata, Strain CCMP722" /LENGTH=248 /DNA_ID=CAMNT_0006875289 /DNA_START=95 /DNA_END=841 /DNA_ORIENTATION=-
MSVYENVATGVYFLLVPVILAYTWALQGTYRDTAQMIDITVPMRAGLPEFESPDGLPDSWRTLSKRIKDGDHCNLSELKFCAHTGTHLDAPTHFVDESQVTIADLDLDKLNGPVLVVEAPVEATTLTAEVMKALDIPPTTRRLIIKTRNTKRNLMYMTAFDSSYVGFDESGAEWLVENTAVQMIGIDYLSIASYAFLKEAHVQLLKAELVPVEGLDLREVSPGLYTVHCLPLKLHGADGSPCRCILYQ